MEEAVNRQFKVIYVEGTVKEVTEVSRKYLMTGYQLAADPLAGRRERPTPYLTVIMEPENAKKDHVAGDILRVEWFCAMFYDNKEKLEQMPESYKKDFQLIDYTLSQSVCDKIYDRFCRY